MRRSVPTTARDRAGTGSRPPATGSCRTYSSSRLRCAASTKPCPPAPAAPCCSSTLPQSCMEWFWQATCVSLTYRRLSVAEASTRPSRAEVTSNDTSPAVYGDRSTFTKKIPSWRKAVPTGGKRSADTGTEMGPPRGDDGQASSTSGSETKATVPMGSGGPAGQSPNDSHTGSRDEVAAISCQKSVPKATRMTRQQQSTPARCAAASFGLSGGGVPYG
mmetsp:Transcript_10632/g.36080  ORF Transcript_10632/g.36080 Transcript_10632/m.36080 type:complete len:218 (+) Transcript_10632:832-1485(+)